MLLVVDEKLAVVATNETKTKQTNIKRAAQTPELHVLWSFS